MAPTLPSWPLCHHLPLFSSSLILLTSLHAHWLLGCSWLHAHWLPGCSSNMWETLLLPRATALAIPFPLAIFPHNICVPSSLTSLRSWPKDCLLDVLLTLCQTAMHFPILPIPSLLNSFLWPLLSLSSMTSGIFIYFVTSVSSVLTMILAHGRHQKYLLNEAGCLVVFPSPVVFIKYLNYSCP